MADLFGADLSVGSLIKASTELMVALLCAMTSGSRSHAGERLDAFDLFWRLMAIGLLLLSANSLLHGEVLFLSFMREAAKSFGLYEWRRVVQSVVLVVLIAWLIKVQRHLRQQLRQHLHPTQDQDLSEQALLGAFLVLGVVVMNGVSLHYVDSLITLHLVGISLANWFEGLGLACVALSALRAMHRSSLRGAQGV